ncbi:hypothetical protein [Enterovibrio norvegicus]|uniref:hypothetical protein n=1 Tax=Enterovibrio norvegicus TaxID=188144 RepID=UPI00352BE5AD
MKKEELLNDPIVKMLLEDVKGYVDGNKALLPEAKRSVAILKKEYDVTPSFIASACDAGMGVVSEVW